MGLFDFFKSDARGARQVERWRKRLMNKYQQTQERQRAIDALCQMGTDEAIAALLGRFTYRTEQSIVDEEEKQLVYERIVAFGDRAVPALEAYVGKQVALFWAVKALREIVGPERTAGVLLDALDQVEDSFGVNRERREVLVDNLRMFADDPRVYQKLLELVRDEDEEIVIRAVDGLSAREDDPNVPAVVVPLLLDPETSFRLRTLILELVLEKGWNVKRFKRQLKDKLPEGYFIDDTGVVRRR